MVDPGPDTENAWDELKDNLQNEGATVEDVERVLITHPHPDHFGLASRLQQEGATVCASHGTSGIVRDFVGRHKEEKDYFVDFFVLNGMEKDMAETVVELPELFLNVAPSVDVDRELDYGDVVDVDGTEVKAEEVRGHAVGETIFTYEDDGQNHAIVGDHVLHKITPNPLLQPPEEEGGRRPRVLPQYNRSLKKLSERDFDLFLPGHRDLIHRPIKRIGEMMDSHNRRTAEVREILEHKSPITAYEMMDEMFGDLPVTEYFPGMSESVGHLDVLEERGKADHYEESGIRLYEPK